MIPVYTLMTTDMDESVAFTDMEKTLEDLRQKGAEKTNTWEGFSFSGLSASIKGPSSLTNELRKWRADGLH